MELEILSIPNKKTYGLYSCPTQLLKYVSVITSHAASCDTFKRFRRER